MSLLHLQIMLHRVNEHLHIKVADFGLARDIYIADYYRNKNTEKLPVKWMAPEALHDRVSNEKTDVVSLLLCRAELHGIKLYNYVNIDVT